MATDPFIPRGREIELALRSRIAALKPGDPVASEAASAEGVGLLGIRVRDPLLVEHRLIREGHGRPLGRPESHCVGDRHALVVAFEVDGSRPAVGARPRPGR